MDVAYDEGCIVWPNVTGRDDEKWVATWFLMLARNRDLSACVAMLSKLIPSSGR